MNLAGSIAEQRQKQFDGAIAKTKLITKITEGLTPQEKNKIAYHRDNLGKGYTAPDGRPMTIYAIGPQIREGRYKGKFVSVPGFVPGVNNNKPLTEDQALEYWADEIEAGEWPIYNTGEELNAKDKEVHTIMDYEQIALEAEALPPPSLGTMPTQ